MDEWPQWSILFFFKNRTAPLLAPSANTNQMQCTSYFRDPYETAAWQLYLRECALRAAKEEVAFLEATGGMNADEMARIRQGVMSGLVKQEINAFNDQALNNENNLQQRPSISTISLKSILADVAQTDAVNQLCRCVRPLLEREGITTFKKHQAIHVMREDVDRVRDLGLRVLSMA